MAKILNVTSNTDWNIKPDTIPDWLDINPTSGNGNASVSVACTSNTGEAQRIANLVFRITDQTIQQTVTITQASIPTPSQTISIDPHTLSIPYTAQTQEGEMLGVATANNNNWTAASNQSWLIVTKYRNDIVNYICTENTGSSSRTAMVTVTSQDGTVTDACVVTQARKPAPTIYDYSIYAAGGVFSGGTPVGNYAADTTIILPTSVDKNGYIFKGFVSGAFPGQTLGLGDTFTMPASNQTFNIVWEKIPDFIVINVINGDSLATVEFSVAPYPSSLRWVDADISTVGPNETVSVSSDWQAGDFIAEDDYCIY